MAGNDEGPDEWL